MKRAKKISNKATRTKNCIVSDNVQRQTEDIAGKKSFLGNCRRVKSASILVLVARHIFWPKNCNYASNFHPTKAEYKQAVEGNIEKFIYAFDMIHESQREFPFEY